MSRTSALIVLGILVILTPFSGFPIAFRTLFAVVCGLCTLGIGFSLRTKDIQNAQAQEETKVG